MDTAYDDEQQELKARLRRFLEERAPLDWVRERWEEASPELGAAWTGLASMGVTGVLIPERCGGFGGGMCDAGAVLEELGRMLHPGPWLGSAIAATSAAVALGADALLPGLADGSEVGALAFEEPHRSPLDWRTPNATCERGRISGVKQQVIGGMQADWLLVSARDGVYRVSTGAGGVERSLEDGIDPGRRTAQVTLRDAPAERVGDLDDLAPAIDRIALALCAEGLGAAERALELAVEHAKQRVQFDRPIGAFQAVAHLCADMLEQVELARAGLHYALWAADHADPAELHRAAVMAKAFCSENLPGVVEDAIQVFAGVGFTWEYDIHLYYKRLLALEQALGGPELWLEELARIVI